jgi:hypothetical protein
MNLSNEELEFLKATQRGCNKADPKAPFKSSIKGNYLINQPIIKQITQYMKYLL